MREARRAGTYPAAAATTLNTATIPMYVTESLEVTPYSRPFIALANAHDPAPPSSIPNPASAIVWRTIPA